MFRDHPVQTRREDSDVLSSVVSPIQSVHDTSSNEISWALGFMVFLYPAMGLLRTYCVRGTWVLAEMNSGGQECRMDKSV